LVQKERKRRALRQPLVPEQRSKMLEQKSKLPGQQSKMPEQK
jgi:hypothetical protein